MAKSKKKGPALLKIQFEMPRIDVLRTLRWLLASIDVQSPVDNVEKKALEKFITQILRKSFPARYRVYLMFNYPDENMRRLLFREHKLKALWDYWEGKEDNPWIAKREECQAPIK